MFKSLCDLPCGILCLTVVCGGGSGVKFVMSNIVGEGSKEGCGSLRGQGSAYWIRMFPLSKLMAVIHRATP